MSSSVSSVFPSVKGIHNLNGVKRFLSGQSSWFRGKGQQECGVMMSTCWPCIAKPHASAAALPGAAHDHLAPDGATLRRRPFLSTPLRKHPHKTTPGYSPDCLLFQINSSVYWDRYYLLKLQDDRVILTTKYLTTTFTTELRITQKYSL